MKKVSAINAAILFPVLLVVLFLVVFEDYTQLNIGRMYEGGFVVQQDTEKAKEWYRKPAAKGFAPAQNALGLATFHGQGDRHDKAALTY